MYKKLIGRVSGALFAAFVVGMFIGFSDFSIAAMTQSAAVADSPEIALLALSSNDTGTGYALPASGHSAPAAITEAQSCSAGIGFNQSTCKADLVAWQSAYADAYVFNRSIGPVGTSEAVYVTNGSGQITNQITLRYSVSSDYGLENRIAICDNLSCNVEYAHTFIQAHCAPGLIWSGTVCTTPALLSVESCEIGVGQSTCKSPKITWWKNISGNLVLFNRSVGPVGLAEAVTMDQAWGIEEDALTLRYSDSDDVGRENRVAICDTTSCATEYVYQFVRVGCATGLTWNGTVCAAPVGASSISAGNCTITAGSNSCTTTVTWSTSGLLAPSIRQGATQFSTVLNNTVGTSRSMTRGTHVFSIVENGTVVASTSANAECAQGSGWNGVECASSAPTASADITAACPNGGIQLGQSTCRVNVDWSSSNVTDPSVRRGVSEISTNASGPMTIDLGPGTYTFAIFNGSTQLDMTSLTVSCAAGVWQGGVCVDTGVVVVPRITFVDVPPITRIGSTPTIKWTISPVPFDGTCRLYGPTLPAAGVVITGSGDRAVGPLYNYSTFRMRCEGPYPAVEEEVSISVVPDISET